MMTISQIRSSIVEHVTDIGKQIDGEYHKALTAFMDFVERKDQKIHDAVVLLTANGYTVNTPTAAPATSAASAAQAEVGLAAAPTQQ